jgi:hypothetical protein
MVPRNVFCSATCPVRTAAERAPREVGVLPGIWARAQAGAPAALCGRASSLETRNLFPLAPLLGTRFPHRSPIHSPHLRITQACFSGSQPRNLQNSVTNSYSGKVISTATSHRAPLWVPHAVVAKPPESCNGKSGGKTTLQWVFLSSLGSQEVEDWGPATEESRFSVRVQLGPLSSQGWVRAEARAELARLPLPSSSCASETLKAARTAEHAQFLSLSPQGVARLRSDWVSGC